jgi:hypothetical protein
LPNTATEAAADIRARLADAWNAGDAAAYADHVLVEQDGRWFVAAFHNTRQEPRG